MSSFLPSQLQVHKTWSHHVSLCSCQLFGIRKSTCKSKVSQTVFWESLDATGIHWGVSLAPICSWLTEQTPSPTSLSHMPEGLGLTEVPHLLGFLPRPLMFQEPLCLVFTHFSFPQKKRNRVYWLPFSVRTFQGGALCFHTYVTPT